MHELPECFSLTRYEMVRVTENQADIPVGGRGLFSYLVNNVILGLQYIVSKRLSEI